MSCISDDDSVDVSAITEAWECPYGDYDSALVYDEDGVADSIGYIEDCSKHGPPYCKFCPNQFTAATSEGDQHE